MTPPVADWTPIAAVGDIPDGHAARVEIGERPLAIFNLDGTLYCLDDTCSHAEASLSDGDLDGRRCAIECPLHGSAFSLRTGEPLTLPAVQSVQVHDVTVIDGVINVALREG